MRSVLAQLSVIISVSLLLTACPSNEGAKAVSDPEEFFVGPLPQGLPVFLEINEPYWAHDHGSHASNDTESEGSLSLFSIALPETGEAVSNPVAIFSVSSDQVTSLNTALDENDLARTDISVLVSDGNVYKVDHQKGTDNTGSIRLLNHFVNKVCEIIPVDVVQTTTVGSDDVTHTTHTVLHSDEIIYVVTVEGAFTDKDCNDPANFKRYYELPLNFQFNAHDDDESKTNELKPPVSESLARGKLMFGWVDDEPTESNANDQLLTYGYLGYSSTENKLRFYDEDRLERWCQPRALQTFDVEEIAPGEYSKAYLFELKELEQQHYQLQMGLDVFVFESSSEIFAKPNNVSYCELGDTLEPKSAADIAIENILTDRIFKTNIVLAGVVGKSETVTSVVSMSDDNEVVIVDDSRVYRYTYLVNEPAEEPVIARSFTVQQHAPISIDKVASQSTAYPFSQFDLKLCSTLTNASECNDAHNIDANDWQFITGCDANKGCSLTVESADLCATADELDADPNAGSLCTVLDYRHLDEFNIASNDAEFRGFMQYNRDFINSLSYTMHDNSLFITARMTEKEILLRYSYNIDLAGAKADRETVFFGEKKKHFGFDVYINDDNLFATVLWKTQKREHECYKNYLKVNCNLGKQTKGSDEECSAFDLAKGDCFNGFQEYESMALFCSDLAHDGDCNDGNPSLVVNVNGLPKSAKWLRMFDLSTDATTTNVMYLLASDKTSQVDEGVLTSPTLYAAVKGDDASIAETIIDDTILGQLNGNVEAVRTGWLSNDNLARFDVINQEVKLLDQTVNSVSNIYMATGPKVDSLNKQVVNVGEVNFPRLVTQLETSEE